MKKSDNLIQHLIAILMIVIGGVMLVYESGFLTFIGVFLLIWSNNISVKLSRMNR